MKKTFINGLVALSILIFVVACGTTTNTPTNPEQNDMPNDNTNLNRDSNMNNNDRFDDNEEFDNNGQFNDDNRPTDEFEQENTNR